MAKIAFIASSDWHYHNWKQFNGVQERTLITEQFILELCVQAEKHDVPILMPGDWFHTPKALSTQTLYMFMGFFKEIKNNFPMVRIITISGNHDLDEGVSLVKAMSFAFPGMIQCIDNRKIDAANCTIYGIPYMKRNQGLVEKIESLSKRPGKKILLLHTELYGAPDPSGYEAEPQNLPKNLIALFKAFDLVLAGHIHMHTKVAKNIYMVGAPNEQRKSDMGCDFGYLLISEDFKVEFIKYEAPRFRYYQEGEEHDDTNDFWIEIPKPKKIKKGSNASFKPSMDKGKMAKRYFKETGIKSPKKLKILIDLLNQTDD